MLYYLNNWQGLNHAKMYGEDAFFDLWTYGIEDKRAKELLAGDFFLVLSRGEGDKVVVGTFTLVRVRSGTNPENKNVWILEGKFAGEEALTKAEAAAHERYGKFFNKNGHVNQWSILLGANG